MLPKFSSDGEGIDLERRPIGDFIAGLMQLPIVAKAEWDRELITNLSGPMRAVARNANDADRKVGVRKQGMAAKRRTGGGVVGAEAKACWLKGRAC